MAAVVTGNPGVVDYVLPTASLLTVAVLTYIARKVRKFMGDHEWLMEMTKKHSEQIDSNTEAIRRLLEQRERLIEQRDRTPRRQR